MKKLLRLLLLVCMILPMASLPVHADAPVGVQADFTYAPTGVCTEEFWANDNQFLLGCGDVGTWYAGDFLGSSEELYDIVFHGSEGGFVYEYGLYRGRVTFEGTVMGEAGTLEILFVGKSPGDIADWFGTWRILSGTGGLANLRGHGIFYNNGFLDVHIEGFVHFAP